MRIQASEIKKEHNPDAVCDGIMRIQASEI
jgi:hypothetical protein